ncbi:hypothetical protein E2562_006599 [Oryza meyeriana var. granulata]|uniref:F-box domain-containing protein n=1 Tax=Oryza meyeriana var. granulata TaxID=110450 RepID=A0A6G1EFL7_9ORYZ|nr:hypothetical protein E2562_006599 [Oryza meyeriana var. granulata]
MAREATSGEDHLREFSDDLLRLILRRVDSYTALGTAALGKRWAGLAGELRSLSPTYCRAATTFNFAAVTRP